VRSAQEYEQRHIPGALSIPLLELESRIGELNPDTWYITY
jgi:rhodanese-related sulfurtransferase